ncbi:MAG: translation initiation factor IF-5A [Vulcanisaeta sp.]|jgi:translation initiation factor 5A|nr:translation initiation factor IF-5A [Vulcanisaeta sp.]MCG2869680.1 translation initiation factor IF-5A [Vulcanisaeta sp.]MCG2886652.1 translation initiation factor IF-5A [Vulcanisaeta sp.]MCG2895186.1 translation initiation factor IF-5A [Vulcanisaeta sp.]
MSTKPAEAGSIKEGSYVMIDGEPCKVVEVEKSKTGKHGSAKVRIVGIGVFDNVKRTLIVPADAQVEIPIIEKFVAQVVAKVGDSWQLMDLRNYTTFEVSPNQIEEDVRNKLEPGVEVEVWEIAGRRRIVRIR